LRHVYIFSEIAGAPHYTPCMLLPLFAFTIMLGSPLGVAPVAHQTPATTAAAPDPAWVADLAQRHQALIDRNGPGTNTALRDQLLAMLQTDQNARGISHGQPIEKTKLTPAFNLAQVDAQLTAQLKDIVAKNGWPSIALVGIDASNAAMLILTHAADHAWQLTLLPNLEALADAGKIDGSPLALVIDKELVSEGKLQRYGTQFKFVDGEMQMYGVEDPATLDARRAKAFLPPEDAYKQLLSQMYHLKVGSKIVSAAKPAGSS
jgi:hypothetical protein